MKVLVAGSTGLAGSSVSSLLQGKGFEVIPSNRNVVNFLDSQATSDFIHDVRPDVIIDAAAKVGGISFNNDFPVDSLTENLLIQINLMKAAHEANVPKFLFLGSSCIYPKNASIPIVEDSLLSGPLEPTNSAYAIAKIAGIELIKSFRKQYQREWISVMPCNLYGPYDNFSLSSSHVLPALIRKFSDAVRFNSPTVTLWGTGSPKREFLHVDDLSEAILLVLERYDLDVPLNIGSGSEVSIFELATMISELTNFEGSITWDSTKPDGVNRKLLDSSRVREMGWEPRIGLKDGLTRTLSWYRDAEFRNEVKK